MSCSPTPPASIASSPGQSVDLAAIDPADTSAAPGDKKVTNAATEVLAVRLAELQDILWARQQERVLVVLQGIDTSGKGGTVEHVFGAVNPAGLRVTSFKAPSETELARDYLWRVHANVPQGGEIGGVRPEPLRGRDRGAGLRPRAGDALAEALRPHQRVRAAPRRRGHHDREGAAPHLQGRAEAPPRGAARPSRTSTGSSGSATSTSRKQWDDYQVAFAEAIERTTTEHAPWHVIPADKKWYRNWAVATIVTGILEGLDLTWPESPDDLTGVVID